MAGFKKFESDTIHELNKRLGLVYPRCDKCPYTYHCKCVDPNTMTRIYRDCGCEIGRGYAGKFVLLNYKEYRKSLSELIKHFDLTSYLDEFNIKNILYTKYGTKTGVPYITNGGKFIDNDTYPIQSMFQLLIHDPNNKLTVNNIPCKLFYTEHNPSSYKGSFCTNIIALDFDPYTNYISCLKFLNKCQRRRRLLFKRIPKELISMIRCYITSEFESIYKR